MAFDKRITLYRFVPAKGAGSGEEIPSPPIWADVTLPSVTLQLKAMAADYTADLQAIIWREDFRVGETRAEIDGVRYRITAAAPMPDNPLKVRLLLSREG